MRIVFDPNLLAKPSDRGLSLAPYINAEAVLALDLKKPIPSRKRCTMGL
jgi:hypothetical protein